MSEDWRKANATLFFKKCKKEDLGNHRPVSLSSIHGIVMEKLFQDVCANQKEEKIIKSNKHGFTKGKSCLTNLVTFYEVMTGYIDEGRAVDTVYLGFSNTFDTVSIASL